MQISHVLRGSDLLDSTPRQIALFDALGCTAPLYAHVPLLLGPDGERLSKRHGSITLKAIRQAGTSPERLIGQLAFISGLIDRPEPVTAAELVPEFDLNRLPLGPGTYPIC